MYARLLPVRFQPRTGVSRAIRRQPPGQRHRHHRSRPEGGLRCGARRTTGLPRPEAKYRYDEKHITSLVELQQTIIRDGVAVLNPNGHFLYATCSIDREENGSQVAWMQSKRKLSLVDQFATLPSGTPTSDPATWHDGGFAALLQRKA